MTVSGSLLLIFYLSVFPVPLWCGWTTLASIPSPYSEAGSAASALDSDTVIYGIYDRAFLYTLSTDSFTSLPNSPSNIANFGCARLSPTTLLAVGGYDFSVTAASDRVELLDISSTPVWTSRARLPDVRSGSPGACSDQVDGRLWVAGGRNGPPQNSFWFYAVGLDAWTTKQLLPSGRWGVGLSYTTGYVVSLAGDTAPSVTQVYTVAADVWTTGASIPSARGLLRDSSVALAGFVYVLGGDQGFQTRLEQYNVAADLWTSLAPSPLSHNQAASAMTPAGVMLFFGQHFNLWAHSYSDPSIPVMAAAMISDPVFHTFDGLVVTLHLRAGVFNVFTTPSLVINAMVDTVDSLPPDENMVVVVVGVVAVVDGCLLKIDCSLQHTYETHCSRSSNCSTTKNLGSMSVYTDYGVWLNFSELTLEIQGNTVAIIALPTDTSTSKQYAPASFLNLGFNIKSSLGRASGLIPDLTNLGLDAVKESLSRYENRDGDALSCAADVSRELFAAASACLDR